MVAALGIFGAIAGTLITFAGIGSHIFFLSMA